MILTRQHLGPTARAYYDAQKASAGRPKPCPKCRGIAGNTTCVLCRGSGVWNPLPSNQQPKPAAPTSGQSAVISARTKAAQHGEKVDAVEFANICAKAGLPKPVREFKFHPVRKWRFDYAFTREKLALEVDGGSFMGGRHNRGAGFQKDMDKHNSAISLGWRILRVTPQQLLKYETVELIQMTLRSARQR